jgi:competence protein ComEA
MMKDLPIWEDLWEKNKLQVVLGGFGIFLLLAGVFLGAFLFLKEQGEKSSGIEIIPVEGEVEVSEIFIHVAGAVEKPGLYKLSSDARVNDALVASGGLSAEADREWFEKSVNLAQKLSDGAKLYIPFKNEISEESGAVAGEQESIFSQEVQGKININSASVSELDSLPGIGPAYGQKIIDSRPFNKIEEIMNVPGIGEATFEKIKDKISVF